MANIDPKEGAEAGFESSGVKQLITLLRQEGVEDGEAQAKALMQKAEQKASKLIKDARAEAKRITDEANDTAKQLHDAGIQALRLAARDAAIRLQERLMDRLSVITKRLVTAQLTDSDLLKELIVEVGRKVRQNSNLDRAEKLKISVPGELLDAPEGMSPEETETHLTEFARQIMALTFREGVTIDELENGHGMEFRLDSGEIRVKLTDDAISDVLLHHLQPRFRSLMADLSQE